MPQVKGNDGHPADVSAALIQMTASMMTALLTKAAARLNAIRMTNS
ncbi:MAG: hypothetical protein ACK4ZW_14335 [Blastomonas sp.]